MIRRRPHRIRIEQSVITKNDTTGNRTEAWGVFAVVWGHFRGATVREFIAAGIENVKVVGAVEIDPLPGVTRHMRIPFDGRVYDIEGVLPDPNTGNEFLTLPVSEVTSDD